MQRRINKLEAELAPLKKEQETLGEALLTFVENEQWPVSARVGGATVYLRKQVWAGPAEGGHDQLTAVLRNLGDSYRFLLPSVVNAQKLSGYIREKLDDADVPETATLEERLGSADLPPELKEAVRVTEKQKMVVLDAGTTPTTKGAAA